jgi:hypothetical protein
VHFRTQPNPHGTAQDGFYFHIKPNKAVTMWMALDAADEENGCLVYTTGSHKTGIRPHQASGVLGFSQKCACGLGIVAAPNALHPIPRRREPALAACPLWPPAASLPLQEVPPNAHLNSSLVTKAGR